MGDTIAQCTSCGKLWSTERGHECNLRDELAFGMMRAGCDAARARDVAEAKLARLREKIVTAEERESARSFEAQTSGLAVTATGRLMRALSFRAVREFIDGDETALD